MFSLETFSFWTIYSKNSFYDRDKNRLSLKDSVERMLAYIPMYMPNLTINVHVYMNYEVQLGSTYNDMYDAFHNSEVSKIVSWKEVSSTKSDAYGDIWQASYDDRNRQSNYNAEKDMQAKKIIEPYLKEMVQNYFIFAGEKHTDFGNTQYIEALVRHIDFIFHFHKK